MINHQNLEARVLPHLSQAYSESEGVQKTQSRVYHVYYYNMSFD